jgi:hypothetical protein
LDRSEQAWEARRLLVARIEPKWSSAAARESLIRATVRFCLAEGLGRLGLPLQEAGKIPAEDLGNLG